MEMQDDRELTDVPKWGCEHCINFGDWRERGCYEPKDGCRYAPEIILIEAGLLDADEVKFGVWSPEYELANGQTVELDNKDRLSQCIEEMKKVVRLESGRS